MTTYSAAAAGRRVALVVGNSTYRNVAWLPNPERDAASMATLFRDAGFDTVVEATNVGNLDFKRAIRKFEDSALGADIAVVFYAGHGIEVGGINYLVPVDAKLASDRDTQDEAIALNRVLQSVEGARRLRLVILDACRNNPFVRSMKRLRHTATRSVSSGLGKVEPTSTETLVAYAAKAGSTAEDGDGAHSPFTKALIDNLTEPGLDIRMAFGRVRDAVLKMTDRRQEPFIYGSLGGSIVALSPSKPGNQSAPNARAGLTATARANLEITVWNSTKDSKNPALFESYLKHYPNGAFVDIAKITLQGLKAAAVTPHADAKPRVKSANLANNEIDKKVEVKTETKKESKPRTATKNQQQASLGAVSGKRDVNNETTKTHAHGRFTGRWRLDTNCPTGHYIITANITSATGSHVTGTTTSTSGFSTKILGGKVSANTIRFRRRTSNFPIKIIDTVTGHLVGASKMTGTITGGVQKGACRFTASR